MTCQNDIEVVCQKTCNQQTDLLNCKMTSLTPM